MQTLLHLAVIIPCFAVLAWSADRFVYGAGGLARSLGMSPLLVGLVIVGFGTSAPELLISALAAAADNTGLAVGNALGSNIANIALILGTTALLIPLTTTSRESRRELLALLGATLLVPLLLINGRLDRIDGWILLIALLVVIAWLARMNMKDNKTTAASGSLDVVDLPPALSLPVALGWITVGLALLLISARLLVWAAVELAVAAGVSDLVIGLTIVAAGTSLPELATAIAAARQRQFGMVFGNIIGSNLFNLLGVLGLATAIRPAMLPAAVLYRDYLIMTLLTLLLAWLMAHRSAVGRGAAIALLVIYGGYQLMLFWLNA
ncbi:MAG: calcium/sodium antiporter [Aquisalimonadaceae bacterium]